MGAWEGINVDDPTFGHWLAGFTDGEGCFTIIKNGSRFGCKFEISLRDDDLQILEEIRDYLGVGVIYFRPKPQATYRVHRKQDCAVIQDFFHNFPLRAKKAEDFIIWSKAVDAWFAHNRGDRLDDIVALKAQLELSHKYHKAGELQ